MRWRQFVLAKKFQENQSNQNNPLRLFAQGESLKLDMLH
jgi:hypothetical protein